MHTVVKTTDTRYSLPMPTDTHHVSTTSRVPAASRAVSARARVRTAHVRNPRASGEAAAQGRAVTHGLLTFEMNIWQTMATTPSTM